MVVLVLQVSRRVIAAMMMTRRRRSRSSRPLSSTPPSLPPSPSSSSHDLTQLLLCVAVGVHSSSNSSKRSIPLLLDLVYFAPKLFLGCLVPLPLFDQGAVVGFGLVV